MEVKMPKMPAMILNQDGKTSSKKITYIVLVNSIIGVWSYTCLKNDVMFDLPYTITGILALLLICKVFSDWIEKKFKN